MRIRVSAIIHARTKDVDFRSKLLVVPEDFDDEEIRWARSYIADSTRYFELVSEEGRRVVFCNDKYIVYGISIFIKDLYRKCKKEARYSYVDGNRLNYAFIGLVMLKEDLDAAVHLPYALFLEEYEKFMELRWNDFLNSSKSLENTKAGYQEAEFQKEEQVYNGSLAAEKNKVILPEDSALAEGIAARAVTMMITKKNLSFCSNMPNTASVMESHFDIVTSPRADAILASIKKNSKSNDNCLKRDDKPLNDKVLREKELGKKETGTGVLDRLLVGSSIFGFILALGIILMKGSRLLSVIAVLYAVVSGGIEVIRLLFR